MAKRFVLFAIIVLVAVGGIRYFVYANPQDDAKQEASVAPAQSVSVVTLARENVVFTRELPGRISPFRQSQVRPQVDGIITKRLFEEGAEVEKGQQLYQIDDARYKAALNSALADLKSAQASVKTIEAKEKRYGELVKINAVSKQEYDDIIAQMDQANAAIAVAQAAVDMAQVNLDYTRVYAPIAGRISKSFVTEGALVTANQQQHLATITQLDPVYIDMQQSGNEAMEIRARMMGKQAVPVHILLSEQSDEFYPHDGQLKFSEVTIDETTGSIALRALIPNPDDILLPGLFVRARIEMGNDEVLLVPQRAANRTPDGKLTVWVVDKDNKAQPRPITATQTHKDQWVVDDGVAAGDRVIVEGYLKIAKDTPVKPMPWKQPHNSDKISGADTDKKKTAPQDTSKTPETTTEQH